MNIDKQDTRPAEPVVAAEAAPTKKPKARKTRGPGAADKIVNMVGSMLVSGFLVLVVAAALFGPAFVSEMREDEIMSVLDLSEEALADTSMGDLIDIRKYVDEYKTDDAVNRRAAEKAGEILDGAIEQRIGK